MIGSLVFGLWMFRLWLAELRGMGISKLGGVLACVIVQLSLFVFTKARKHSGLHLLVLGYSIAKWFLRSAYQR